MYGLRATALAPFGVALVLLVANAVVALRQSSRLVDVAGEVSRAQALHHATTELELAVRDAEAAQRGYLVTGDLYFRARYDQSVSTCRAAAHAIIADVLPSDLAAAERHALVEELLAVRIALLDEGMQRYETEPQDAAAEALRASAGERAMRAFGTAIEALESLARTRETTQREHLARAARSGAISLGASSFAALLLLGVAATVVVRDAAERRRTNQALIASEGRLRAIVDGAPLVLFATGRVAGISGIPAGSSIRVRAKSRGAGRSWRASWSRASARSSSRRRPSRRTWSGRPSRSCSPGCSSASGRASATDAPAATACAVCRDCRSARW